jgi:hypothetical protein
MDTRDLKCSSDAAAARRSGLGVGADGCQQQGGGCRCVRCHSRNRLVSGGPVLGAVGVVDCGSQANVLVAEVCDNHVNFQTRNAYPGFPGSGHLAKPAAAALVPGADVHLVIGTNHPDRQPPPFAIVSLPACDLEFAGLRDSLHLLWRPSTNHRRSFRRRRVSALDATSAAQRPAASGPTAPLAGRRRRDGGSRSCRCPPSRRR